MKTCSAYLKKENRCKNGFPLHPICIGSDNKCHACGKDYNSKPVCLEENSIKYVANKKGEPRYAIA